MNSGCHRPIVWTIAGSDTCGGGGIQADLKTIHNLGAHGCSVLTSITAQNSMSVKSIEPVSESMLMDQISALISDLPPKAIKLGVLGSRKHIEIISKTLTDLRSAVICDPVLYSSSGFPLIDTETYSTLLTELFPKIDLLTPNLPEAETIVGYPLHTAAQIEQASKDILSMGVKAVVVKGGHTDGEFSQDYFTNGIKSGWYSTPRRKGLSPRGTGCTFASAVATAYALGFEDFDSIVIAKAYLNQALRLSEFIGREKPFLRHSPWPVEAEDFPWLSNHAEGGQKSPLFPDCGTDELGFYPVVDRFEWLQRLIPLGITTAQLRIKHLRGQELESEIQKAISYSRNTRCRLFINDYWDLALKHGAYGVHLGQEDIETADIPHLARGKLRIGISTHSYSEVARAHALRPSYIAIGPIFPTTLKTLKFPPQGVSAISLWKKLLNYPIVAIGGIKLENALELKKAGANGIAVVSDITQHPYPEQRTLEWLKVV